MKKEKNTPSAERMYEYYRQQEVLPTYGGFRSLEDLSEHERHRHALFTEKLHLPARIFRNARLLEFGPDAGENSLVFAKWGANCVLAEPNHKARPLIQSYFEKFQLRNRLIDLRSEDVLAFPLPKDDEDRFDFVDAEGFIYTVQPTALWAGKLSKLLRAGGFCVLFYIEAYGSFMELMLKVVHSRFREITGNSADEAAHRLYATKWDSIPHKRRMESWIMDVLENPFVRLRYCLEPISLCREMSRFGFRLYSAWPHYNDMLDMHWFKKVLPPEVLLNQQSGFVRRSRLSHIFGRKHFLAHPDAGLDRQLWRLLELVDEIIDHFDESKAKACCEIFNEVESLLNSESVISEPADRQASLRTLASYRKLFPLLVSGDPKLLVKFCNSDQGFIESWGMPSHFAVFKLEPDPGI